MYTVTGVNKSLHLYQLLLILYSSCTCTYMFYSQKPMYYIYSTLYIYNIIAFCHICHIHVHVHVHVHTALSPDDQLAMLQEVLDETPDSNKLLLSWLFEHLSHLADKVRICVCSYTRTCLHTL